MDETAGTAGLSGVARRLAELRAEHGFAEFALEQSTTGTDGARLVSVVVDPTRRLTSLTVNGAGDRSPSPERVERAVDEALVAAEAARSLQSFVIARERGLVAPTALKRRFLAVPDRRSTEAAVMAQPADPPTRLLTAERPGPSSVFTALGLGEEDAPEPAPASTAGRTTHAPVEGGDPERGVRVVLREDGWTSSVRLEPWLASASPRTLERSLLDAYTDAYALHDRRATDAD